MSRTTAATESRDKNLTGSGGHDLEVEYTPLDVLTPSPGNARTHTRHQIRQIGASIERFGFVNPILVDENGDVIAGHGRLEAARLLDLRTVPTIRLHGLSEAERRALALADNKIADNASWDQDKLAAELKFLTEVEIDLDVTVTGFEMAEIDLAIEGLAGEEADDVADAVPEMDSETPVVTQPGDHWLLGRHRLCCGDARSALTFEVLMAGEKAQMVFTDPPYNVTIAGHVGGLGATQHREFPMASGELSEAEFTSFLETCLCHLARNSVDGSIHFICMDWRHLSELLTAGRAVYAELKNLCIWCKSNGGMGSLYRSRHELVLVYKSGNGRHINNVDLGRHGRYRTNVWNYAGANSFGVDRLNDLAAHPTVKPVALIADAILDCSRRGGIVLDSFAGSGSTIIAAERTGRRTYAMELDPRYVDTAIRRWQDYTGDVAVHAETGQTFRETRKARLEETDACQAEPATGATLEQPIARGTCHAE